MPGFISNILSEISQVERITTARKQAQEKASNWTPNQAMQAAFAARLFPAMRPGVISALVKAGHAPDGDVVKMAGEEATRQWMQDHPGGREYGEPLTLALPPGERFRRAQMNEANRYVGMQARRGAEARQTKELRDLGLLTDDNELRSPVPLEELAEYTQQGVRLDPRIQKFHEITGLIGGDPEGEWTEVPFVLPDGSRGMFRPPGAGGGAGGYFKPEPGVEKGAGPLNLLARLGDIEIPQYQGPGSAPSELRSAGPTDVKQIVRGGAMALDAPLQELQGQVRNLYALAPGGEPPQNFLESQSDLGVMLGTGETNTGSGFFVDPESAVAVERRRREALRGQIGGHNVTFGRWVADDVFRFQPDSKPFQLASGLLDAGTAIVADPTSWFLGGAGRAARVADLFAAPGAARVGAKGIRRADPRELSAGIIRGLRPSYQPRDGAKFLDSDQGQQTLGWIASNSNPRDIHRALKGRVDVPLTARLADAHTPDDVRAVLEPELGIKIPRVSTVTINPDKPFKELGNLAGDMPRQGLINAHDHNVVAREAEAIARNARVPEEQIDKVFEKVARAKNPEELNAALTRTLLGHDGIVDNVLKEAGVTLEDRSNMLQIYKGSHRADRRAMMHQTADHGTLPDLVFIGGNPHDAPGLPLLSELSPKYIALDVDAREIRRAVSPISKALQNDGVTIGRVLGEHITNGFKRLALMRPAWGVRVILEEQLRMAAAGYDSMFNHPIRYISWALASDPSKMPKIVQPWDILRPVSAGKALTRKGLQATSKVPGLKGFAPRAPELELADEFADSLRPMHAAYLDQPTMVKVGTKTPYFKNDINARPQFRESLASEIANLASDRVASYVANADSIDEAVEWFTRGPGNELRGRLATAYPTRFADQAGARSYIEDIQARIDYVTGSNGDLLDAVKTGRFRDENILLDGNVNANFRSALDEYEDFWPQRIVGEDVQMRRATEANKYQETRDHFVTWAFSHFMTIHTNRLSVAPMFKQAYWKEGERLIPFVDEQAKAGIIARAQEHNLGSRAIRRMERTKAGGDLPFDEWDTVAKGFGLDETVGLLYDLHKRGRTMDAVRLVAIFGEAWKEVGLKWFGKGGLVRQNPAVVRRAQQTLQGAQGEDFGDFVGNEDGQGFFFKNDYGEEVFLYPGMGLLTEKLLGVPVPLSGRVQGLSMFGTIVPGLGPLVQFPVASLMASKPGPEWLKDALYKFEQQELPIGGTVGEQLVPFGAPGQEDVSEAFNVLNYLPPYIKAFANFVSNGEANERVWANDVAYMMTALKSTGDYGDTPEEMQRLEEDSEAKVKTLYFIQSVAKAFLPAAPDEHWLTFTKDDGWTGTRALATDWRRVLDKNKGDFEDALDEFTDKYGDNAIGATLPHYNASEYAVPMTDAGVQWVLTNPGIEDDLPHTFGFFAPAPEEGKGSDLNMSMFNEDLRTGGKTVVTAEQFRIMMSNVQADMIMQAQKAKVGDSPTGEQEQWLSDWRIALQEEYPDWGNRTGRLERPDLEHQVRELYDAVEHDAVRKTPAGRALREYLGYRNKVIQEMEGLTDNQGKSYVRSDGLVSARQDMTGNRQWLRDWGETLAADHPEFKRLWDQVLSREVRKGTVPSEEVNNAG